DELGGSDPACDGGEIRTPNPTSTPATEKAREGTETLCPRIVERKADPIVPVPGRVHLADGEGKPRARSGRRLATRPGGSGHATIPRAVFDLADHGRDRPGGPGPGVRSGSAAVGP